MATIKSFTSLEQSKKLAEILPIESADMSYRPYREEGGIPDYQATLCPHRFASWIGIPCWSVGALMILMRDYDCVWIGANDIADWQCEFNLGKGEHHIEKANTPIDACYQMVVWLIKHGII